MDRIELIAPCHFGLEAVLKREIQDLGYEISGTEDGRVTFYADMADISRANIFLRTAERVLLKAGEFKAETFDELFERTGRSPGRDTYPLMENSGWPRRVSEEPAVQPSDIQSIMKKAMVRRLQEHYRTDWFKEDGASYPLRVFSRKTWSL